MSQAVWQEFNLTIALSLLEVLGSGQLHVICAALALVHHVLHVICAALALVPHIFPDSQTHLGQHGSSQHALGCIHARRVKRMRTGASLPITQTVETGIMH